MNKKPRILVVGSLVMDLIVTTPRFPQKGETVLGFDFETAPGGKGANQAVQAALLGADVHMVGMVGKDAYGQALLDSLKSVGVDIAGVGTTGDAPTAIGNIQIEVTDSGTNNRILVVPGANMRISPAHLAFLKNTIGDYDMLMLQHEIPAAVNEAAAQMAFACGVPVMLNSAPAAPVSPGLMRCLSFISPNEHEAAAITGLPVTNRDETVAALRALRAMGAQKALITLGAAGAALDDGKEVAFAPALSNASVLDPTAAGDSFVAAFCVCVCAGISATEALAFANATAAITVSQKGAQPSLPRLDAVFALLKQRGLDATPFEKMRALLKKEGAL